SCTGPAGMRPPPPPGPPPAAPAEASQSSRALEREPAGAPVALSAHTVWEPSPRMAERRRADAWIWGLVALTAAGAALRFSTLGVQSFWLDEAVTHSLVTRSLSSMLSAIPHSESTPPLYYLLAWIWVRIFGAGEAGLRSLSAVFGTATIVLLALIARRLAGNRAALAVVPAARGLARLGARRVARAGHPLLRRVHRGAAVGLAGLASRSRFPSS